MSKSICTPVKVSNELIVNLKAIRRPRFKAGAELSAHVNFLDVTVDHEVTPDYETVELKFTFTTETIVPDVSNS